MIIGHVAMVMRSDSLFLATVAQVSVGNIHSVEHAWYLIQLIFASQKIILSICLDLILTLYG